LLISSIIILFHLRGTVDDIIISPEEQNAITVELNPLREGEGWFLVQFTYPAYILDESENVYVTYDTVRRKLIPETENRQESPVDLDFSDPRTDDSSVYVEMENPLQLPAGNYRLEVLFSGGDIRPYTYIESVQICKTLYRPRNARSIRV
jgi:hypothetical protein